MGRWKPYVKMETEWNGNPYAEVGVKRWFQKLVICKVALRTPELEKLADDLIKAEQDAKERAIYMNSFERSMA